MAYSNVTPPLLPAYDSETYSFYLLVFNYEQGAEDWYMVHLYYCSWRFQYTEGVGVVGSPVTFHSMYSDGSWSEIEEIDGQTLALNPGLKGNVYQRIYTNANIFNGDEIWLAADTVTPVEEEEPKKFPFKQWMGFYAAALCSKARAFPQRELVAWETLFYGVVRARYSTNNGKGVSVLWEYDEQAEQNVVGVGDALRISVDDEEIVLVADQMHEQNPSSKDTLTGNKWLMYTNDNFATDDGTDILLREDLGSADLYFREQGVYLLKIDRRSTVNKLLIMYNPHLYNGYKFPVIPERDKSVWPCAAIVFTKNDYHPSCIFSKVSIEDGDYATTDAENVLRYRYDGQTASWSTEAQEGSVEYIFGTEYKRFLWSNYDVLYRTSSGSVVSFEKSDPPSPVYE